MLSEQRVKDILASFPDPLTGGDISPRLESIALTAERVIITLTVPPSLAGQFTTVREDLQRRLESEAEALQIVQVILTADRQQKPPAAAPAKAPGDKLHLPHIKAIIAVASGKGGVGKSTTAVNLAAALSAAGQRTGLLDADIYGPSVPQLLKLSGKPQGEEGRIMPMDVNGLKAMSIGLMVDANAPLIWRGPMVQSAITQLLRDVDWGDLDVLVLDLPPGTGDAQLTLAQKVNLRGAVIVSTPQDLALLDARKAIGMFAKTQVPILGIVENMSQFICPHCGQGSDIFGHGGARHEAEKLGVPLLAEIPLDMAVRELSDAGNPIVWAQPDSDIARRYTAMAGAVIDQLR